MKEEPDRPSDTQPKKKLSPQTLMLLAVVFMVLAFGGLYLIKQLQ